MTYDLILKGGTVVTPSSEQRVDVGIFDGKISALEDLSKAKSKEVIDVAHLHILPGAIDSQVHFREPGLTHKEDISTGSAGAALGGVTGFFEMPNTNPNTDSGERLKEKISMAEKTSWVDFAFYLGATAENALHLGEWEGLPGCSGVKVFLGSSTGNLLVDKTEALREILRNTKRAIAFHSEDETRLKARKPLTEGKNVSFHPEWRDVEVAVTSTRRLLEEARKAHRKVHVLHVTTAEEVELLKANKDIATFEVTPQHLTIFAPDCYERLGTLAQMNPPIREKRHFDALWQAVVEGHASVLGSDHAPHTLEEKREVYPKSPSGMPGVQTLLPLMLNHVAEGRLTLSRVVELSSYNVAKVFGLQNKGRIELGKDADFAICDLKKEHVISNREMKTKCGWTPFDGKRVKGWPVMTVLRGQIVMRDGVLVGAPNGRVIAFTK